MPPRCEDYGPAAEKAMAHKRADYFAAGTQVVWDVEILREGWIAGWTFPVDELFE